jgi:pimeloyl-ACP methyl ester carboxylesterase
VPEQELAIGGYTDPTGSRTGFDALLVGYYTGEELRYAGKVGTGFDERTLTALRRRLDDLAAESPRDRAGSVPPVVFCHGTPFSSLVWQPFATALASDFTVYLWDMPGYGLSSKHPDHPVGFGAQAEAFADLLRAWLIGTTRSR